MSETVAWALIWVALLWSLLDGIGLVGCWFVHKEQRRGWWLPMAAVSFATGGLCIYFMATAWGGK